MEKGKKGAGLKAAVIVLAILLAVSAAAALLSYMRLETERERTRALEFSQVGVAQGLLTLWSDAAYATGRELDSLAAGEIEYEDFSRSADAISAALKNSWRIVIAQWNIVTAGHSHDAENGREVYERLHDEMERYRRAAAPGAEAFENLSTEDLDILAEHYYDLSSRANMLSSSISSGDISEDNVYPALELISPCLDEIASYLGDAVAQTGFDSYLDAMYS